MTIKRTTAGKLLRSAAGHLCLSCCDDEGPADPCASVDPATYYLSCDIAYTRHEDAGGGITDCDGTGGTETCNTTASMTDEPLNSAFACLFESDNNFTCYFPTSVVPPDPNYTDIVQLFADGADWRLNFGSGANPPEQSTTIPLAATPVGTYPDITYCYFDGYNAYNLSITNIVITA